VIHSAGLKSFKRKMDGSSTGKVNVLTGGELITGDAELAGHSKTSLISRSW
jgi:hypothetical protein